MQKFTTKIARLILIMLIFFFSFPVGLDVFAADIATGGSLIKINGISSVYYLDPAGQRHPFPNETVYFSWYADFNQVSTITPEELQGYPLSANVTMRPGTKLIKITTDPAVYAVEPGGVLRKIPSESEAANIYGSTWSKKVVDVPDSFFTNYTVGAPLSDSKPSAGTIVKSADTKYYYFDGNKYRQITDAATFYANRFNSENIVNVNTIIDSVVVGIDINSAEDVLSDIHANNTAQGATSYNAIANNNAKKANPSPVTPPGNTGGGGGGSSSGGGSGSSSGGGGGGGTVNTTDTSPPIIQVFSIQATSSSLTVPVLAFTVTDNVGVDSYLLTETSATPAATAAWINSTPTTYTFSEPGSRVLYAWSRDAKGNISLPATKTVEITLPDTTLPIVNAFSVSASSTSLTISINNLAASDNVGVSAFLISESNTKPLASAAGWSSTTPSSYIASSSGTITLYAWAKDSAGNVSNYLSALVTITLTDTIPPQIISFSIPTTSTTLTVPISTLTASDNLAVTGYLITESAIKPTSGFALSTPLTYVFSSGGNKTLYAWAKDAAGNISSSLSDTITISLPDTSKPTITAFSIPASSDSLSVSISSFTATDNMGITGYLLTETASEPQAGSGSWASVAPITYTFSTAGNKTLYAWAKDAAGNIAVSMNDSVVITITVPDENKFYISPNGNDTTGNGSIGSPWKSLYKACNSVTSAGKTIHVNAGTYTETLSCSLAVGVNIEGEGVGISIIKGTYVIPNYIDRSTATIRLYSPVAGTNGNQSISNLTLDGNGLQGSRAVAVYNRGNVKIHDSVIKDFYMGGVIFSNSYTYSTDLNAILEVNNEIYNNTIDNCGDSHANPDYSGGGLIAITNQKDMLIHDNLLYSNKRIDSHNGNIINAGGTRFRGVKYYNNQSWKPDMRTDYVGYPYAWNFHIEVWGNDGGFEIYNNTFTGGSIAIDIAGYGYTENTGGYPYSWSIHDNVFQQNDPNYFAYSGLGILLESRYLTKTLIYNNSFSSYYRGVTLSGYNVRDVYVHNNTFNRIEVPFEAKLGIQGTAFAGVREAVNINFYSNTMYINTNISIAGSISLILNNGWNSANWNIYNNTMVTNNTVIARAIYMTVSADVVASNFNIKNNIFHYFKNGGPITISNSGAVDGLHIENNLSYNLNNYNVLPIITGNAINNYTYSNNIPISNATQTNPLFVNESGQDYHLQPNSPAINSGQNVGLPFNGPAPDMGVFEY